MNITATQAVSKPLTELFSEKQKSDLREEPPSSVHPPQAGHSAPPRGLWGRPRPLTQALPPGGTRALGAPPTPAYTPA